MNNQKGFSLLEMTVVIAIIAILAAVAMFRGSGVSKEEKLKEETATVESMTKEVQSMSLAPRSTDITQPLAECGYGIRVENPSGSTQKVFTFKDKKDTGTCGKYDSGIDEIIKEYNVPSGSRNIQASLFRTTGVNEGIFIKPGSITFTIGETQGDRKIYMFHGPSTPPSGPIIDCTTPCDINSFAYDSNGLAVMYWNEAGQRMWIVNVSKSGLIDIQ